MPIIKIFQSSDMPLFPISCKYNTPWSPLYHPDQGQIQKGVCGVQENPTLAQNFIFKRNLG